jgi:hypothetical protein
VWYSISKFFENWGVKLSQEKEMMKRELPVIYWREDSGMLEVRDDGAVVKFELHRGQERSLDFTVVSRNLRWLQGEILTVLEAVIDDERKLKATKDLVRDKVSSKISWIYELCGLPENGETGLDDPQECICVAEHSGPCESDRI